MKKIISEVHDDAIKFLYSIDYKMKKIKSTGLDDFCYDKLLENKLLEVE